MPSKPSIYFVSTEFGDVLHGPAVYTQILWDIFRDSSEFDFHLIVLESKVKHPRIHVHESGLRRRGFYRRLESHIRQLIPVGDHPTLVHVNSAHLISPSIAARYRTIVQVNDTEVCQHRFTITGLKRHGLRRMLALSWRVRREKKVIHHAEMVVCNSDHTKQMVKNCYHLNEDNVVRVYKAIRLEPFLNAEPQVQEMDPLRLIFIGNNWYRKGLDVLFQAVGHLYRSNSQLALEVDVYGQPGSNVLKRFRTLAAQYGVIEKIHFQGMLVREQAPSSLAGSSMLILPSFEEALGLTAIEAIATGIPVVGSRIGGIPEIINSRELGTLVETGNSLALANAIETQAAQSMDKDVVQFRKNSSRRFDVDSLKDNLTTLYRQLFSGSHH